MDIDSTGLMAEVKTISALPKPMPYTLSAVIHVVDKRISISSLKVISLDLDRDYEAAYADTMIIELLLPSGEFDNQIQPFASNLDITLYRTAMFAENPSYVVTNGLISERYTAVLIDKGNEMIEGNYGGTPSQRAADLIDMTRAQFQLIEKTLEQVSMASAGLTCRNSTVGDALRAVMTTESTRMSISAERYIKGTYMVPGSNTEVREHVIVPQGIPVTLLPHYFQTECGGVYSAGMGYYLQGLYWYIWPSFDTTRFATKVKTLTIIRLPPKRFAGLERTWRQSGSNTVILANSDAQYVSDSDSQQLTLGSGARFADASKMMESFTETADNKTVASRADNNSEFVTAPRGNGNNKVTVSAITANQMVEFSKLARRTGAVMAFEWQNSVPDLIVPGMPVRILHLVGTETKELQGVLLKAFHYTRMNGEGMMSEKHITNSMLSVFLRGK